MFPYTAISGQDKAAGKEWTERWAPAKQVCDRCVVRIDCLEDALTYSTHSDEYGMRGGLTPQQRNRIRLSRNRIRR